jgi:hypothetical protein
MEWINWNKFNEQYVRLVVGVEKKLKLTKWTAGDFFGKYGINFLVLEEDGNKVEKQFTVISRRLIRELKPIIVKAEEDGKETIAISILRTGEGFNTRYTVKELPPSFKELFT